MATVPWLTVNEVAERLSVHPSRVRSLISHDELPARKVGRQWLVDEASVDERLDRPAEDGRPLSPQNAWAFLWQAAGEHPDHAAWGTRLSHASLWRTRRRIATASASELLRDLGPRLRRRGKLHRLRAHPADVPGLLAEPALVRTGVSAAADYGADIVAPGVAEAYVRAEDLPELRQYYLLEPGAEANILLRAIERFWPFPAECTVAPVSAVALDLIDSDDERTRRAGRELLARLGARAP